MSDLTKRQKTELNVLWESWGETERGFYRFAMEHFKPLEVKPLWAANQAADWAIECINKGWVDVEVLIEDLVRKFA